MAIRDRGDAVLLLDGGSYFQLLLKASLKSSSPQFRNLFAPTSWGSIIFSRSPREVITPVECEGRRIANVYTGGILLVLCAQQSCYACRLLFHKAPWCRLSIGTGRYICRIMSLKLTFFQHQRTTKDSRP